MKRLYSGWKKLATKYFCKLMTLLVNLKAYGFLKIYIFLLEKTFFIFPSICLQKVGYLTINKGKIRHWDNTKWPFGC